MYLHVKYKPHFGNLALKRSTSKGLMREDFRAQSTHHIFPDVCTAPLSCLHGGLQ